MIIPTGFAQANLKFSGTAAPTGAEITLGFDLSEFGGNPADAAQIIADEWDAAGMDARQVDGITLANVLVKFGPNSIGPSAEVGVDIPGTTSDDGAGPQVAALCQKITAIGGRAGRGRFYLPGISENSFVESGQLGDTFIGNLNASLVSWLLGMGTADLTPVLLHAEGSPVESPTPITTIVCAGQIATQRRRNRR